MTLLLDKIYQAFLMDDPAALDCLENDPGWESIRIMFSAGEGNGTAADLGLGLDGALVVVPAIKGPGLVFHSADIVRNTSRKEPSVVAVDHTISFDSNFAEILRSVFNGGRANAADYDRVVAVLRLKANDPRVQFDILPFLLENVRLARNNDKNDRPLNTIIAFRMIDYLDWEALRSEPPLIAFCEPPETLRESLEEGARAYLEGLFNDAELVSREKEVLAVEALLLRLTRLWHSPPQAPDLRTIFCQLIDFCLADLPALPMTELSIIWSGFSPVRSDFFAPVVMDNIRERPRRLSGMAWDIAHLRLLERFMRRHEPTHFSVAHFATNDAAWRVLLGLNPIHHIFIDDSDRSALVARERELPFQRFLNECLSAQAREEVTPEKREARRRRMANTSLGEMKALLQRERDIFSREFPHLVSGAWPELPM